MEEIPPLDPNNLPDLQSLPSKTALYYVASMLEGLVVTYENLKAGPEAQKMSTGRRPSHAEATAEANLVARSLGICNDAMTPPPENESAVLDESPTSVALEERVEKHQKELEARTELHSRFWLKNVPDISIQDYVLRFHKYCRSSTATYLAAGRYVYIMSIEQRKVPVTRLNVFRLFCAAYIVAAKIAEDLLYPFKRYATTAGLSPAELSRLEISFLFLVDFEIKIDSGLLRDSLHDWAKWTRHVPRTPAVGWSDSASDTSTPQLDTLHTP